METEREKYNLFNWTLKLLVLIWPFFISRFTVNHNNSHHHFLGWQVFKVRKQEGVTVGCQQDLVSAGPWSRTFFFHTKQHIQFPNSNYCKTNQNKQKHCEWTLGYSRTALFKVTGQVSPGMVELFFSLSAPPPGLTSAPPPSGASACCSCSAAGLNPFCMVAWPQPLASRASMKETLSGSRVTWSSWSSGELQDRGQNSQRSRLQPVTDWQ